MKLPFFKIIAISCCIAVLVSCKKDDSNEPNNPKSENQQPLGSSAEELLSDALFTSLTVELVYSGDLKPDPQSLENLQTFLEQRLNKPGGILFVDNQIDAPTNGPYTSQEVRAIENENRTLYNTEDNITLYIYFANSGSANDANNRFTLGTAYLNTSMVIYEETIRTLAATGQFNLVDLETTTLQHEMGHILGLVNIQHDDIHTTHEDPNSNRHCVVENCLMYFESNGTTVPRMEDFFEDRSTNAIPQLDALCLEDLRIKGGK